MMDGPHPEDRGLAERALAGQPDAVAQLAKRLGCAPRFLAVHNRRLGHPLEAEDLADATQETVTLVWSKLREYRGDASLETFVYAVSKGVFMNAVRRRGRLHATFSTLQTEPQPATHDDEPQEFEHVYRSLAQLAPADQALVRAKCFDGLTFDEIAQRFGQGTNTLKTRYYRALRRLRDSLDPTRRAEL